MRPHDQITPHFQWHEFDSWEIRGGVRVAVPVPFELAANVRRLCVELEILRAWLGAPITVICGYRTEEHNEHCYRQERARGDLTSGKKSRHRKAKAADIRINGFTPVQVHAAIEDLIELGKIRDGGLGLYKTFVHYDIGKAGRRW